MGILYRVSLPVLVAFSTIIQVTAIPILLRPELRCLRSND